MVLDLNAIFNYMICNIKLFINCKYRYIELIYSWAVCNTEHFKIWMEFVLYTNAEL